MCLLLSRERRGWIVRRWLEWVIAMYSEKEKEKSTAQHVFLISLSSASKDSLPQKTTVDRPLNPIPPTITSVLKPQTQIKATMSRVPGKYLELLLVTI
jgi:hypothetical protein